MKKEHKEHKKDGEEHNAHAAEKHAKEVKEEKIETKIEQKPEAVHAHIAGKKHAEEPRVGVFVCKCGLNIAATVNVEEVAEYAKGLKDVAYSEWNIFTCSDTSQRSIIETIKQKNLNRVVVASCSPQLHEKTFRRMCAEAGLNPYLFEMANIREHCSWVHVNDKRSATQKAKDLVSMAVAKARLLEPLPSITVPVTQRALVIGGGIAGQVAALDIANMGFETYLVEKQPSIGGAMAQLDKTFPTLDCSICIQGPIMSDVGKHPNIKLLTYSELKSLDGYIGNFTATITKKPRYVDTTLCNGCGACYEVCPVKVPSEFDRGMGVRPAIYRLFPQAVPALATIDKEHCINCSFCELVCEKNAIKKEDKEEELKINVGTAVVSTGFDVYDPTEKNDYHYNDYNNIITAIQLERLMNAAGPTKGKVLKPGDGEEPKSVAFVLCIGTRDKGDDSYCSGGVCCMYSLKLASMYKDKHPEADITLFYIDIRSTGKGFEELFTRARQKGIKFIRGKPAQVRESKNGNIILTFENTLAGRVDEKEVELLVLSTGMLPAKSTLEVARTLHISRSPDGFLLEKHPKLAPVDTATDGIYLAGAAQGPKDIPSAVAQARAAAIAASIPMRKGKITLGGDIAHHIPELCTGCGTCTRRCAFGAWELLEISENGGKKKIAKLTEALCKGCGTCAADCPKGAIEMKHFTDAQILSQIEAALQENPNEKILAMVCNWCTYAGADNAGVARLQYPSNVRVVRVMCSGRVNKKFIESAFELGAGMVLVSGCHPADCHYISGNQHMANREKLIRKAMERAGVEQDRFRLEWISASEGVKFQRVMTEMAQKLRELGPRKKMERPPEAEKAV